MRKDLFSALMEYADDPIKSNRLQLYDEIQQSALMRNQMKKSGLRQPQTSWKINPLSRMMDIIPNHPTENR